MNVPVPLELLLYPLAVFIVYLPALNGPPIFDDLQVIPEVEAFKWGKRAFFTRYRRLTLISFLLQRLWPWTIRSLHVGNMMIHAVNGLLLKGIASALGMDEGLALLCGLLFVIHPFAVNSVGYITGRASLLAGTFGLLAIWFVLDGLGVFAIPSLFCSFLAKEDGVGFVFPVFAILIYRAFA